MLLCGTDLSVASDPALKCAAALARKHGWDLSLVHVVESESPQAGMDADVRLEQEAGDLRRTFGVSVETIVAHGAPELKLLELAREHAARMIVVGAEGKAQRGRKLGSVPEYLCQRAEVPVFVARNADPLVAWSQGARPLRALVGSGMGDASRSALAQVADWPDLALTVTHIAWPFGEHYRLGVAGAMPLDHLRPEVHHQLLGDLGRWTAEQPCRSSPKLNVTAGFGRIDCHLAQLASEKEAEVLVIGTHQRNLASRLWQGSVSRNAIHEATCNVMCVPQRLLKPRVALAPRTIVVPTDFSSLADRAISHAYGLAASGGCVHLVHVASTPRPNAAAVKAELGARVPRDATEAGVTTELQILEGADPWLAIWQYASRVSADMICMATHSRDAVKSLVLGSQAQALLQHSRIPVLLVPPDRES
jgi:nucleotide-binding universal stress UspA family protein